MQLSTALLRSVALGIGLGMTTACSIHDMDNQPDLCSDECSEECDGQQCQQASGEGQPSYPDTYSCPACGMG